MWERGEAAQSIPSATSSKTMQVAVGRAEPEAFPVPTQGSLPGQVLRAVSHRSVVVTGGVASMMTFVVDLPIELRIACNTDPPRTKDRLGEFRRSAARRTESRASLRLDASPKLAPARVPAKDSSNTC